jgi:hypothetical protein
LGQPDLVGTRVNSEEEIALMDDIPVLEVYSREGAARLSAKLNGVDRRKLAKEAQARIEVAYQRLANHYLRKWVRAGGDGSNTLAI